MSLADEFRQAQLDVCAELRRDTPYNPSRFEQGIRERQMELVRREIAGRKAATDAELAALEARSA